MKISATIITLNEERNIERCITSLKGVADEIIVFDSNSTDNTEAICKVQNVRFVQGEWLGYSASKNYVNGLASFDYIFSIDADEALDNKLREEILELKKLNDPEVYSVNRRTNYCGKWIKYSGWYPDVKIRLFPKATSYWEGEYVHEKLVYKTNLTVKQIEGHLEHYSYYSYADHRDRADKYSALTARKMFEAGKKASAIKPYLSAIGRFLSMFVLKGGFMDGKMGFRIAKISAVSNILKYKELRRLNRK